MNTMGVRAWIGLLAMVVIQACVQASADDSIGGIAVWWRADGNALDSVGDSGGVLVGGASYSNGVSGGSFAFDGISGYVAVSNAPNMDFGTNDFTIAVWAKWSPAQGGFSRDQTILSKLGGSYPHDWGFMLEYVSGFAQPVLRFAILDTRSNINDLMLDAPLAVDRWFHVAAVRTGNTNRIYLDGVPLGEKTAGTDIDTRSGGQSKIGALSGLYGVTRYFGGCIDDLRLYGRALSDAEVFRLGTLPPQMSVSMVGGAVDLSWTSQSNRSYAVSYRGDLSQDGWSALGGPVVATGHVTAVQDTLAPADARRFYRVATPLP